MIELASGFYKSYLVSPEVSILMIGLDGSGKTTLLERIKVTEFKGLGSSSGTRIVWNKRPVLQENVVLSDLNADITATRRRRRLLACPAPKIYRNMDADKDEYFQEGTNQIQDVSKSRSDENQTLPDSVPKYSVEKHDPGSTNLNGKTVTKSMNNNHHRPENDVIQYDMKQDKTMFPQHLIRPTVGMNLGKIEACSAKVKIFDLGGSLKMIPLWERYYKDIDAVMYVLDVSPTAKVTKLMESRAFFRCMRDDEAMAKVPVLIFANKMDTRKPWRSASKNSDESFDNNTLNDTSLLDIAEMFLSAPRGSSNSNERVDEEDPSKDDVAMFAGSAKTGEGVRVAFEWIIRKATDGKL